MNNNNRDSIEMSNNNDFLNNTLFCISALSYYYIINGTPVQQSQTQLQVELNSSPTQTRNHLIFAQIQI